MPATRSLALKSLGALAGSLRKLPDHADKAHVLDGALDCVETLRRWREEPPAMEAKAQMMSRILKLHVAATWLRRG
jgi:hypothetical protein